MKTVSERESDNTKHLDTYIRYEDVESLDRTRYEVRQNKEEEEEED